ncbi:hypothetical protein [Acutalibacter intestini]|uniref:hypothetical protein n=1 Tax=Acutalibacter intestini TaxID=3093659 RepID=UPI002AC9035E|nr:hypothetical protein [Acutalibacter sp. M00204]
MHIALCIPTYENSKVVEDFLINCAPYYMECGIDIYFYDSSREDATEKVVKKFMTSGRIHYIAIPEYVEPDEKTFMIFQGYGITGEYDFIWLSGDGVQYPKEGVQFILSKLDTKYDLVTLNSRNRNGVIQAEIICDINNYFQTCAVQLTLYGAAILNTHTVFRDVNWDYYKGICLKASIAGFSHISFIFHRILELEQFCGLNLNLGKHRYRLSTKKKTSSWYQNCFSTWVYKWTEVIESLPDYYENKMAIVMSQGKSLLGNVDSFKRLKLDGVYSYKVFRKYIEYWNKVTEISLFRLFLISIEPKFFIRVTGKIGFLLNTGNLKRFCRAHAEIYILGAGRIGEIYGEYFIKNNIPFQGFFVLPGKAANNEMLEHPVFEFQENHYLLQNTGIVLALGPDDTRIGLENLSGLVPPKDIFNVPSLRRDIAFESGYKALNI